MSDEETPQAPGIVAAFAQPEEGEAPQRRRRGVGPDPMEMLRNWTPKTRLGHGVSGPNVRAAGHNYDVRLYPDRSIGHTLKTNSITALDPNRKTTFGLGPRTPPAPISRGGLPHL